MNKSIFSICNNLRCFNFRKCFTNNCIVEVGDLTDSVKYRLLTNFLVELCSEMNCYKNITNGCIKHKKIRENHACELCIVVITVLFNFHKGIFLRNLWKMCHSFFSKQHMFYEKNYNCVIFQSNMTQKNNDRVICCIYSKAINDKTVIQINNIVFCDRSAKPLKSFAHDIPV